MSISTPEIKLYFDYKSPYAYLAMGPALDLPGNFDVTVRCIPYLLRLKGKGQRSIYSEWKVKYSYVDARRWANKRGGLMIRGPQKIYDSTASLIGALYAQKEGFFRAYSETTFSRFFERRLEIDVADEVAALIDELGHGGADYLRWLSAEGAQRLEACIAEGMEDEIFGVPIFVFEGEKFWGYDRLPLLEERLEEAGLSRQQP